MFLFTIPTRTPPVEHLMCAQVMCSHYEPQQTIQEEFIQYALSVKIKGYCRGCMGQRDRYDCSAIISKYLIDKGIITRRINSYILANYGHKKTINTVERGDLVVMINKGTGSHHTAIYRGKDSKGILIMDLFEKKTQRTVRRFAFNHHDYTTYYIGNPAKYKLPRNGFNKNFRNFIGKNYYGQP